MSFNVNNLIGNFIDNKMIAVESDRKANVFNPATGEISRQVTLSSVKETQGANLKPGHR